MSERLNIALFASGRGSNFEAILSAIRNGFLPNTDIAVVISNNADAGALSTARSNNIPAVHLSRKQFASDEEFVSSLLGALGTWNVNFIVLAGYMKKVDPAIVRKFRNRILNIHPALLPKYGGSGMYGMHVHEAVLRNNESISGATVHVVDEEYDRGPIVLQKSVEISPNETPVSLAEKILNVEHEIYPRAIRLFAEGKIKVDGSHVTVANQ